MGFASSLPGPTCMGLKAWLLLLCPEIFFPLLLSKRTMQQCTEHVKLDPLAVTAHVRELKLSICILRVYIFLQVEMVSRAKCQ
jgi:hypothetical protein